MERALEGKVALVTGAGRNIGRAIALRLARDGAAVAVNGRHDRAAVDAVVAEIAAAGGRAMACIADVSDERAVAGMADTVGTELGGVDILVGNAGLRRQTPFLEMGFAEWREILAVSLDGMFLLARALAPAMAALRVDFTLDLPLTATALLALWRLGCWCAPAPQGGRWSQALTAAAAVAAAVMVKQSALLVLLPPCLWAAGTGLRQPGRRLQVGAALALVLAVAFPWLKHNWITTIGGTNRAVLESGAAEGDPSPFSLASLFWYPKLWPAQLGGPMLTAGAAGAALAGWRRWRDPAASPQDQRSGPPEESSSTGSGGPLKL